MTDQNIPADLTPREAKAAREWATDYLKGAAGSERVHAAARVVLAALPSPPLPTLADMTDEERAACQWMQADLKGYESHVVIANPYWGKGSARVVWPHMRMGVVPAGAVTPRPNLPRMEWPGDQKPAPAPAPALPDGWRLADHQDHGRVIVTTPTPDIDGEVYVLLPAASTLGYDWLFCTPDELTYIDTGQEDDQ